MDSFGFEGLRIKTGVLDQGGPDVTRARVGHRDRMNPANWSLLNGSSDEVAVSGGPPTLFADYPDELLHFAVGACVLFTLLGVPGNFITIVALLRYTKVGTPPRVFLPFGARLITRGAASAQDLCAPIKRVQSTNAITRG